MAEQIAEGKRVKVPHFSSMELCHYVDARDVARMQLVLAEHPAAVGQIFNCAGPEPVHGFEFIEAIQRLVPGIEGELGFPWSMAQGGEIAFDMSKAKRLLGFEPRYTLADSVASIVEWVRSGGLTETQAETKRFGSGVRSTGAKPAKRAVKKLKKTAAKPAARPKARPVRKAAKKGGRKP